MRRKIAMVCVAMLTALVAGGLYFATDSDIAPAKEEVAAEVSSEKAGSCGAKAKAATAAKAAKDARPAEELDLNLEAMFEPVAGGCSTPCPTADNCEPPDCLKSLSCNIVDLGVRCCNDNGNRVLCSGTQTVHTYTCPCGPQGGGPGLCPASYSYNICSN